MARPVKLRCVTQLPSTGFFKPVGLQTGDLQKVCLSVEEVESIRLKDFEGLEQEGCAQRMRISRPTFHRVLGSARKKLADALINGKAIQVKGGNFGLLQSRFRCNNDGHEWNVPFETLANGFPLSCPTCSSVDIQSMSSVAFGKRCGRRFRGGRV